MKLNNKLKLSLIAIATLTTANVNAQTLYSCIPEGCPAGQYFDGRKCLPLTSSLCPEDYKWDTNKGSCVRKSSCNYKFDIGSKSCGSYKISRESNCVKYATSKRGQTFSSYVCYDCVWSGSGGSPGGVLAGSGVAASFSITLASGDSINGKTCDDGVLK